jgi:hypothetical protein
MSKKNRPSSTTAKGKIFEQEVEDLLTLMGYAVSSNELVAGTQVDLVAEKTSQLDNLRLLVECTDRSEPVGIALVKEKAGILASVANISHIHKLLFVSKSGFTAEAKKFAEGNPAINLLTLGDLEGLLIDFSPYARWYLEHFDNSDSIFAEGRLAERYVELNCNSSTDDSNEPLSTVARRWLKDDDNNLLFLLGEFGSGKTSFCRRFAYELLDERYRRGQPQTYIPILVNLRENRRAFDLPRILTDTLSGRYGVSVHSFQAFEHFCTKRHICLLLDGLDEMVDRSDRRAIAECLEQVFLLASLRTKTILTCRTNFFNSNADIVSALQRFSFGIAPSEGHDQPIELTYKKHGRILHVAPLDESQIRKFIAMRSDDPEAVIASIRRIHDLTDLSRRPVLLDMILKTLPSLVGQSKPVNSADLYSHYTDQWTARDDWRITMPLPIRQAFCEALAWTMHTSNIEEVGGTQLEAAMTVALRATVSSTEDMDRFKNDLKTCSFLTRIGTGDRFRFAHKSFMEFFVARRLTRILESSEVNAAEELGQGARKSKQGMGSSGGRPRTEASSPTVEIELGPKRVLAHELDWMARWDSILSLPSTLDFTIINSKLNFDNFTFRLTRAGTVQTQLETQLERVLGLRSSQGSQLITSLTQEISTFTIELLENRSVPLEKILRNCKDESLQSLLADILRLSKFKEYVRRQATFVANYIKSCDVALIQLSMTAALIRSVETIDADLVPSLRSILSEDGFTYILFELAARRDDVAASAFEQILSLPELSPLDRVICQHGLDKTLPTAERSLVTLGLVDSLLHAGSDVEFQIGLSLTETVDLSGRGAFEMLKSAFQRAKTPAQKMILVAAMRRTHGESAWKGIRILAGFEPDKRIRSELFLAEEAVRTQDNAAAARRGWNADSGDSQLRETLWRALRSKSRGL